MKNKGFTPLEISNFDGKNTAEIRDNKQRKSLMGFTLIELLVVVTIIGILASIVLVSLGSARVKARDTRRIADLRQVTLALEFYVDKYRHYPPTSGVDAASRWQDLRATLKIFK